MQSIGIIASLLVNGDVLLWHRFYPWNSHRYRRAVSSSFEIHYDFDDCIILSTVHSERGNSVWYTTPCTCYMIATTSHDDLFDPRGDASSSYLDCHKLVYWNLISCHHLEFLERSRVLLILRLNFRYFLVPRVFGMILCSSIFWKSFLKNTAMSLIDKNSWTVNYLTQIIIGKLTTVFPHKCSVITFSPIRALKEERRITSHLDK